jgi:hypothetical protein
MRDISRLVDHPTLRAISRRVDLLGEREVFQLFNPLVEASEPL